MFHACLIEDVLWNKLAMHNGYAFLFRPNLVEEDLKARLNFFPVQSILDEWYVHRYNHVIH